MAKTKKDLVEEAKALGLEIDTKKTVAQIQQTITTRTAITPDMPEAAATPDEKAVVEEPKVAKAGKRSAKALEEEAEREAKEARRAAITDPDKSMPAPKQPPSRSRLERRGKHFRKSAEQLETGKSYRLEQAAGLAKRTSHVKFDATVELHVNLSVDPRLADQNIRDNLLLPAGTGTKVRIAVLTDDTDTANKAGADFAGTAELLAQLDQGSMNFDLLIATPALMPRLGKSARVLGPRGLMPNPKSGTVTNDIGRAVAEAKAGRVEYRVDSTGIVHLGVGKVSFTPAQLLENVQAVLTSIKANKPNNIKGNYLKSVHLTTTMGPSIKVDLGSID